MDINIDREMNEKIVECFKEVLKDNNVSITFEIPSDDVVEASLVSSGVNNMKLEKKVKSEEVLILNHKYYKYLSKDLKNRLKTMTMEEAIKVIKEETKYLFYLKPFFGDKVVKSTREFTTHHIIYNNIIFDITMDEYTKLNHYTKYTYKLRQLENMNILLKLTDARFTIVFDEEMDTKTLYKEFYDTFKDILKPRDK